MRDSGFERKLAETENNLDNYINSYLRTYSSEASRDVCESFVRSMENRLLSRATPEDGSEDYLYNIIDNISISEQTGEGWIVNVPEDEEGLVMFLEYGTGLAGENAPKSEGFNPWRYAINRGSYIKYGGKEGFVFEKDYDRAQYIDQNDIVGLQENKTVVSETEWVHVTHPRYKIRRYVRKRPHGPKSKTYTRIRKDKVFSQGLRPTRFIYETIQSYKSVIENLSRYRGDYREALNKLEKDSRSNR